MRRTRAFTLVELLVVIAIIGMLVAILLPAVNSVRESGRRTTCKNRLRQQAIALRSYATQFDEAMPAIWNKGGDNEWDTFSWRVTLLPFLEEDSRYDRINQNLSPLDSTNVAVAGPIEIFNCPSAPSSPRSITSLAGRQGLRLGATDYVAVFDVRSEGLPLAGAWFGGESPSSIPMRDHAMEDLAPSMAPEFAADPSGTTVVISDPENARIRKIPSTLRRIRDGESTTVLFVEQAGKPFLESPGSQSDEFSTQSNEGPWLTSEFATFSAPFVNRDNHQGPFGYHSGASVAMCDGSVHFWSTEIEARVMFALLSREGEEIVSTSDW